MDEGYNKEVIDNQNTIGIENEEKITIDNIKEHLLKNPNFRNNSNNYGFFQPDFHLVRPKSVDELNLNDRIDYYDLLLHEVIDFGYTDDFEYEMNYQKSFQDLLEDIKKDRKFTYNKDFLKACEKMIGLTGYTLDKYLNHTLPF